MQKHQWRQHGIVHAKLPESLPPSAKPPLEGLVAPSSSAAAHFREDVEEQLQFEEQQLQPEQLPQPPVTYQVVEPATAISIQEKNDTDDVSVVFLPFLITRTKKEILTIYTLTWQPALSVMLSDAFVEYCVFKGEI